MLHNSKSLILNPIFPGSIWTISSFFYRGLGIFATIHSKENEECEKVSTTIFFLLLVLNEPITKNLQLINWSHRLTLRRSMRPKSWTIMETVNDSISFKDMLCNRKIKFCNFIFMMNILRLFFLLTINRDIYLKLWTVPVNSLYQLLVPSGLNTYCVIDF